MHHKPSNNKMIHFQGHVDKVETRKDRSVKMTILSAKEMTKPDELAQLFSINEEVVSVAMKVGQMLDEEIVNIPEPKPDYRGEKSQSQRLRSVIFRLWEQNGKHGDFILFYRRSMERLIDQYKEKL